MVLQPNADGQIVTHRNLQRRQLIRRSDPREHQQLRGIIGASRHNHFAGGSDLLEKPVARDLDPCRSVAIEQNSRGESVSDHLEIGPSHCRVQIGDGGAAAHAVALRALIPPDSRR